MMAQTAQTLNGQFSHKKFLRTAVAAYSYGQNRKGIRPVKTGRWFVDGDILTGVFARLIAPVVTTIPISLSSNKIQNGDFLVLANLGPPGKWPLKHREIRDFAPSECSHVKQLKALPQSIIVPAYQPTADWSSHSTRPATGHHRP